MDERLVINPSNMLNTINRHLLLTKEIIDSEKIILEIGQDILHTVTVGQSGIVRLGECDFTKAIIISSKLLVNVLSSLKVEKEVAVVVKATSIEFSGTRKYALPITRMTDELANETYKPTTFSKSIAIEPQIASLLDSGVSAISRIAANAPIKTIVSRNNKRVWFILACSSAIGYISYPTQDESTFSSDSSDRILLNLLPKVSLLEGSIQLHFGKDTVALQELDSALLTHTLTYAENIASLSRVTNLITDQEPVSACTVRTSDLVGIIKDASAIAVSEDRVPMTFNADGIDVNLILGSSKYEFKSKPEGYTHTGDPMNLGISIQVLGAMLHLLHQASKGELMTIHIYAAGASKILRFIVDCPNGTRIDFVNKVQSIEV